MNKRPRRGQVTEPDVSPSVVTLTRSEGPYSIACVKSNWFTEIMPFLCLNDKD